MNMKTNGLKSIFIVDDDPFYQNLLKQSVFNELGINAETFSNGEECIKHLYKMPEIILLDHNLNSKLSGIEVLKAIKSFSSNIQVVFLSGQEEMHVAVNALKYGAFDYVRKNEDGLKNTNQLILKIKNYNHQIQSKKAASLKKKYLVFSIALTTVSVIGLLLNYFTTR